MVLANLLTDPGCKNRLKLKHLIDKKTALIEGSPKSLQNRVLVKTRTGRIDINACSGI